MSLCRKFIAHPANWKSTWPLEEYNEYAVPDADFVEQSVNFYVFPFLGK